MRNTVFLSISISILLLFALALAGCDDPVVDESGGVNEYAGEYINVIGTFWDGSIYIAALKDHFDICIFIHNNTNYQYFTEENPNGDSGYSESRIYTRDYNAATLTSGSGNEIIGAVILTSPTEMTVILNPDSEFPEMYYFTKRSEIE